MKPILTLASLLIALVPAGTAHASLTPLGVEQVTDFLTTDYQVNGLVQRWNPSALGNLPKTVLFLTEINETGVFQSGVISNLMVSNADKAIGLSQGTISWQAPERFQVLGLVISNLVDELHYFGVAPAQRSTADDLAFNVNSPVQHITFVGTVVPEAGPSALLLSAGVAGVLWLRRRS